MKKSNRQFLVIGLGRFGSELAQELYRQGAEVFAVDQDMNMVEALRSRLTDVMQADAQDEEVLREIGATEFDAVIVSIGNDVKVSSVITMMLKELGAKYVIAKANDDFHGRMLSKLGADKVIYPERDMGQRIAHNLVSDRILDFIELSPDYSLMEMQPRAEWIGRTLGELQLRQKHRINVVAVRTGDGVNALPNQNTMLSDQDVMLVVTQNEKQ